MPEMDGIEAFHEIRKMNKDIPVIAVTAFASESERREIMAHGFTDYISKPINIKEFKSAIRNVVSVEDDKDL
jgi:CheY-like chemotaxis protein